MGWHWFVNQVWPNLFASGLWVIPGFLWGRLHFKKLHQHNEYTRLRTEQLYKHLGLK